MVRFAEYLQRQQVNFLCICAANGYAHRDLERKNINARSILPVALPPDYYYASATGRHKLVNALLAGIGDRPARIITFCMRDLYTVKATAAKIRQVALVHLILHIQDDLYVGQTLWEKLLYKVNGQRGFSNVRAIAFNRALMIRLNSLQGLICMADLIAAVWQRNFGIQIPSEHIVPLPSFMPAASHSNCAANGRKILWIGRLVDFKIPALLAMIDFLGDSPDYRLTIIGGGDRRAILARMEARCVTADRVEFMGEVGYADLEAVITDHSIGYAMGTSLVELARFSMPVIVALASYTHRDFDQSICGGLFFDQPRGCDGSELALTSEAEIGMSIGEAVSIISKDWHGAAKSCYEYARANYSVEDNFAAYLRIAENALWLTEADKDVFVPSAPALRRTLFSMQNGLKKWARSR